MAHRTLVIPKKKPASEKPVTLRVRADGTEVRQMTVHMPEALRKKLLHHCIETDQDMSHFIVEAVTRALKDATTKR